MKKSTVAAAIVVATLLSSCGFTTTCPTYTKKPQHKEAVKDTRI